MDKQTIKQMYRKQTDIWIKKQMTDGQENPIDIWIKNKQTDIQ